MEMMDLFSIFTGAGDKLLAALLSFFSSAIAVVMAASFIFTCTFAEISIYIGLGIGPFLLVLSMLRIFKDMVGGWLKFMITAGLYKVCAAAALVLMESIFEGTAAAVQAAIGSGGNGFSFPRTGAMFALVVLSVIGLMTSLKIGDLAKAIVSGGGGGIDASSLSGSIKVKPNSGGSGKGGK